MSVPILDEAYMERRRQVRYWQSWSDSWRSVYFPDSPERLRDEYALGKISYDEFERRLEKCLQST